MSEGAANWTLLPKLSRMSRFTFVDVVLWGLRVGVVIIVVGGTVGTLIKGRYGAAQWFDFLVFGVTIGSVYALVTLGYTMVYGVLRLINFAHGDIMMTGAFAGYFVASHFAETGLLDRSPALALAGVLSVAVSTSTIIALLTERLAYRPFRHVRGLAPLICAIGVSFFLEQTFRGAFGSGIRAYPDPKWQKQAIVVDGFSVPLVEILVVAAALVSMAVLYVVVQRTRMGIAMRAISEDADTAALMGIDVDRVVVFTFALGGAMAGIAGVCYAFVFKQVYFFMGFTPGIKAFGAAVLGGIGSVPGAMLGGLFLGIVESIGPALFLDGIGIAAPYQLRDLIAFTLLIMVLVFRPYGIMGERMAKKRA
ncbi:MAG: branched-chain amino acid ABC transporter permease [Hyphomicrobiales bacterium]|nr:branched-chain amino acid ABC transporter permease [Hyphomicrobiales bacterium]